MKIVDIRFILILAVILAAMVLASSCGDNGDNGNNGNNSVLFQRTITRDNEILTYLKAMQAWQTKWNDNEWRNSIEDNWKLIGELLTIAPPKSMKTEHDDYVLAHRLFLTAEQNLYNLEQIQEKFFTEEDWVSEFIGADFESGEWVEGIPEYIQASKVMSLCSLYMVRMEAQYEISYFWRLD